MEKYGLGESGKKVFCTLTVAVLVYLSVAPKDEEFVARFSPVYQEEHELPLRYSIPQFQNTVAVANTTGTISFSPTVNY